MPARGNDADMWPPSEAYVQMPVRGNDADIERRGSAPPCALPRTLGSRVGVGGAPSRNGRRRHVAPAKRGLDGEWRERRRCTPRPNLSPLRCSPDTPGEPGSGDERASLRRCSSYEHGRADRFPPPPPPRGECGPDSTRDLLTGRCVGRCPGGAVPIAGLCAPALPLPFPTTQATSCAAGEARDVVTGQCVPSCASGVAPVMGVCWL